MADIAEYVTKIEAISSSLVRIVLSTRVSLDYYYYSKDNYEITDEDGNRSVLVRTVVPVYEQTSKNRAQFYTEILLHTTQQLHGHLYKLTIGKLTSAEGFDLVGHVYFTANQTKVDLMTLPKVFDSRVTSVLATTMRAIAMEDSRIGADLQHKEPPQAGNFVILSLDNFFVTDDQGYILLG